MAEPRCLLRLDRALSPQTAHRLPDKPVVRLVAPEQPVPAQTPALVAQVVPMAVALEQAVAQDNSRS